MPSVAASVGSSGANQGHPLHEPAGILGPITVSEDIPAPPGPSLLSEHRVISDDDPSRLIEDSRDIYPEDDNDHESGLMDDGLGEEDEDDDEDDSGDFPTGNRRPMRSLRPLPSWLQTTFGQRVEESSPKHRGADGLPPLYRDHKTFWFPRPAAFFALQELPISPQTLYQDRMLLWDPMPLVPGGIMCPNAGCNTALWRHSHVNRPRRVVDISGTFWIIGYRYRCPKCVSPNHKTFRSWDSRILAALPQPLAAEFPALLTYRSGISLDTFLFMRSCFQSGMGAKQFSNALRVQHLQKYDQVHLSYLQTIALRSTLPTFLGSAKYKPFLPFTDRSADGIHGFIPSSQWLRDVYDNFIERHQHDFNQHMAMLSAQICAVDHSFKVC